MVCHAKRMFHRLKVGQPLLGMSVHTVVAVLRVEQGHAAVKNVDMQALARSSNSSANKSSPSVVVAWSKLTSENNSNSFMCFIPLCVMQESDFNQGGWLQMTLCEPNAYYVYVK